MRSVPNDNRIPDRMPDTGPKMRAHSAPDGHRTATDRSMSHPANRNAVAGRVPRPLYTPEQRARRDATVWTLVQGILAPVQFLVFLVSLVLVGRFLLTGDGQFAADASVVAKTLTLYTIMVTGAVWEKVVFGKYLFADAFFWEDAVSMIVIALHTAYMAMLVADLGTVGERMFVALAAYATYVVNAGQFVWKLRMARLQGDRAQPAGLATA